MNPVLRIAVADDEPEMQKYYQKCLSRLGHRVVAVASTGRELVEQCRATVPDLVIADIKMPDMDGIDAATTIFRERPVPVILVSAFYDADLVERADAENVLGYLVKPLKEADLGPMIGLAMRRFAQIQALHHEAAEVREAFEDHKVIERAKSLLVKRAGLDEAKAERCLQKIAGERGCKLSEAAHRFVLAENEGASSGKH
jgi:response regulator NasT